jgi:hypothetical protein
MATLFEAGVDQRFTPRFNHERWALCEQLVSTGRSLHTKRLIRKSRVTYANGEMYARAWAIMAYLYSTGANLNDYARALQKKQASIASFEACFLRPNQSFTSFDKDLRSWVMDQSIEPSGPTECLTRFGLRPHNRHEAALH